MFNKEKAIIYPFDREFSSILRHQELINAYEIVGVVSPNGWGFNDKDVSYVDGGKSLNVTVSANYNDIINNCDVLILSSAALKLDFEKSIYPKIEQAIEKNKKVISMAKFDTNEFDLIQKLCSDKGGTYIQYPLIDNYEMVNYVDNLQIEEIKTPIIFVLGVGENTHKFEIQLSVRENLLNMGYKVSHIGSRNYCEILGFHSFPQFMFSKKYSEGEKIKLFNNFIKNIEMEEKPDVIVIGVPGTIMRINDVATYDFGVLAFEISQAVKPDASILSVLYEDYLPLFFEKITKQLEYKFGCNISCFNYVNSKIDWDNFDLSNETKCIDVNLELINNKIEELGSDIPIFNIMNEEEGLKITEYLVDKLACKEYEIV